MSEQLRQAFDDMLRDEPPVRVDVDDIVDAGRQRLRQRHRRRQAGLLAAAAAVFVVAVAGVVTWASRDDGNSTVEMSPATTPTAPPQPTTSSAPRGPEETSSTTLATTTTTVTDPTATSTSPGDATGPGSGPGAGPSGELLGDPGFERSPIAWQAFGPARLVPSQDARTGGQALAVEATTLDPVAIGATSPPAGGVVAGTTYQASCWVRSGSDTGARVQLQEQTAGTPTGDPTVSGATLLGDPTRWSQVTVAHTATGSGDGLALTVYADELTPGTPPLLIDDCTLTATP